MNSGSLTVLQATWWLTREALALLIRFWPVSFGLALAAAILWLTRANVPGRDRAPRLSSMLWLFPALCLVWGAFVRYENPAAAIGTDARIMLGLIAGLLVAAASGVVFVTKGERAFAAAHALLVGWCCALAVAAVLGATLPATAP